MAAATFPLMAAFEHKLRRCNFGGSFLATQAARTISFYYTE
jgi:hypothetical protein